jgi:Uma2 family endonuclease
VATQTTLTLDQFLSLPEREPDGTHYELSEGELITLSPAGYRHGVIVMNIGRILGNALDRKRYIIAGGEAGFILNAESTSGTIRGADVAVDKRESVGENPPIGFLPQAPLLAIEVVSPSNTAADLERKVEQYLGAGTLEVWLLYPDTRRLYVYRSGRRDPKIFAENERFDSILGCEFKVDPFFEI